jgi:hypothetical protein
MPGDRKLAKPRRKPCDPDVCPPLEVSGLHCRTPVRSVLLTGQTGQTHQLDRPDAAASGLHP